MKSFLPTLFSQKLCLRTYYDFLAGLYLDAQHALLSNNKELRYKHIYLLIVGPRRHHSMCALDDTIYLIGGFGRHRIMLQSVVCFNTRNGEILIL